MATIARSTFSISKIIDGRTLTFNLSCSAYSQIKSKDPVSFLPDFSNAGTRLVVTPTLYVSGGGGINVVNSAVNWWINGTPMTNQTNLDAYSATVNVGTPYTLEIGRNITNEIGFSIKAQYSYTDPTTNATTMVEATTNVTKSENASSSIMAQINAPLGDSFKTTATGVKASPLTLEASMIRGAEYDITDVSYKWSVLGTGGTYYHITSTTAPAGSGLPTGTLFGGAGTKILTVYPDAVINVGTFMCEITDTDTSSESFNKTIKSYFSLYDMTDPFELKVTLPLGSTINVNNPNDVTVLHEIWQLGSPVSTAFYNGYKLSFYRNTSAGVSDTTWVPSPAFSGYTVSAGVVTRTTAYTTTTGTNAARTITIKNTHLISSNNTVFNVEFSN